MATTSRSLRFVIVCLLLAMTVTSCPEVNRVLLDKVLPIRADVIDSAQYMGSLHP